MLMTDALFALANSCANPGCANALKRGQLKFCSQACSTQARRGDYGHCAGVGCGKPLTKSGLRFCSRECSGSNQINGDWTIDTIYQLRELWNDGLSAAEIGRRMGISKNSVIGKARRLKLQPRPSPIKQSNGGDHKRPGRPKRAGPVTLGPVVERHCAQCNAILSAHQERYCSRFCAGKSLAHRVAMPRINLTPRQGASLWQRPARPAFTPRIVDAAPKVSYHKTCQFPQWGDDERPTHLFCGAVTEAGRSYCRVHTQRCYRSVGMEEAA